MNPDTEQLVEDVVGHALTLHLLGRYLAKAHGGDVRRRDRVDLPKADLKTQGGHAFKTVAAYANWLADGGREGARQLAVLRLLGLFDRPADAGCLAALRREPAIAGLTEPLVGLEQDDWSDTVANLAECGLVVAEAGISDFKFQISPRRASVDPRVLCPAASRSNTRMPGRRRTAGCTSIWPVAPPTSRSRRSTTSSRCTRPWPTAARRAG